MEIEKVSIGDLIESGKLNGRVTGPIWTGFPLASVIGDFPVSEDNRLDEAYKRLLKELEDLFIKYRKNLMKELETGIPSMADAKGMTDQVAQLLRELMLMPKYKVRTEVMLVAYVATYELLLKTNPSEVRHFKIGAKQQMRQLQQVTAEAEHPVIALSVDKEKLKAKVISILTDAQSKKFRTKSNMRDLRKMVEEILGVKNVPEEDVRKIIEKICASLYIADAAQVFKNEYYGSLVYTSILYNYLFELYQYDQSLPPEERKHPELTPESIVGIETLDELFDIVTQKYKYNFQTEEGFHAKLQTDYIYENIDFIDIKKLFMAFLLRSIDTLDSIEIQILQSTKKEDIEIPPERVVYECEIDTTDGYDVTEIRKLCKVRKKILEGILRVARLPEDFIYQTLDEKDDDHLKEVPLTYIKEKMKNFCGDFYLNSSVREYLRVAIFKSRHEELIEDTELMRRLEWSENEIQTLAMVDSNVLKKWLELGFMTPQSLKALAVKIKSGEIDEIIETSFQGKGKEVKDTIDFQEFITRNVEAENISVQEFIEEYFMEGLVSEEQILALSEEQIAFVVTEETLLQVYQMYAEEMASHQTNSLQEDEEKMQALNKKIVIYTKLFEKAYLKDLTKEEQAASKKDLIEEFYLNLVSQDIPDAKISPLVAFMIQRMLQNQFVDYETIYETSFMGIYIKELRARNDFSLEETRKIRDILGSKKCGEIIGSILDTDELTPNQKFALIMDFFFQKEDYKIRDALVKRLDFFDQEFLKKKEEEIKKRVEEAKASEGKEKKGTEESIRHAYSDAVKWDVYHNIMDRDVRATAYANGYIEFYSPRTGKRFFEKFYKIDSKTGQITGYGYGFPTYEMDDKTYMAYRAQLIKVVNGREAVNPMVLEKLVPKGPEHRTPHITQSERKNWIWKMVEKYGSVYGDDRDALEANVAPYVHQHEIID